MRISDWSSDVCSSDLVISPWRGRMSYRDDREGVTGDVEPPKLLDQVRQRLRVKHYSLRTEQAYVGWIRRFILANGKRHPREMGEREVEAFLTVLATKGHVAAGTQNKALSALLFVYREVLKTDLPWMESVVRAKRTRGVPGDWKGGGGGKRGAVR